MITAREDVLEDAVEPAQAALDDRRAGLGSDRRHSGEAGRLRSPSRCSEVPGNQLLIIG
jgi:hypothetical protein